MALARERRWWCGHPSNVWLPCEPPHDIPPPPCLPTTTESWSGRGRLVNSSLPRISCQEFTVWQKPTSGSFFGLFFQSFFFSGGATLAYALLKRCSRIYIVVNHHPYHASYIGQGCHADGLIRWIFGPPSRGSASVSFTTKGPHVSCIATGLPFTTLVTIVSLNTSHLCYHM